MYSPYRTLLTSCVFIGGLTVFPIAGATALDFDESIDCAKVARKGGTSYELSQCQGRDVNDTEFQLTRVYKQLRSALKDDRAAELTLIQAQRAWIAWRDKEADLCATSQGWQPQGSGYGLVFGACKAGVNQDRITQLRGFLRTVRDR